MNVLKLFGLISAAWAAMASAGDGAFLYPLIGAVVFFVAGELWSNWK